VRSADRSISSAVQKEATCCLYMDHRSACSRGKREKRDPQSSVRQIGSMNDSSSVVGSVVVRITGCGGGIKRIHTSCCPLKIDVVSMLLSIFDGCGCDGGVRRR